MRAPCSSRSLNRGISRLGAACALFVCIGALVLSGASASMADQPKPQSTEATSSSAEIELVVSPADAVIDPESASVELLVAATNAGSMPLENVEVALSIDPRPNSPLLELVDVANEGAANEDAADTTIDTTAAQEVARVEFGEIAEGDTAEGSVTVPTSELPLTSLSPSGVYVLVGALRGGVASEQGAAADDDEEDGDAGDGDTGALGSVLASSTGAFVWRDSGTARANVSLIVPFGMPDAIVTMPTRDQLDDLVPVWSATLEAAASANATLAIDPRVLVSLRALGTEASAEQLALLARFEALADRSFLLQFSDADLAAQAELGREQPLALPNLDFISRYGTFDDSTLDTSQHEAENMESGEDTSGDSGTDSSTDSGTDSGAESVEGAAGADEPSALPTSGALAALPGSSAAAWPADGQVSAAGITMISAAGFDAVVLDSQNVKLEGGPRATLSHDGSSSREISTWVSDHGLRLATAQILGGETAAERASGAATIAARTARVTAADDAASASEFIIGLDRGATWESSDASEAISAVQDLPWVSLQAINERTQGQATLVEQTPGASRLELLRGAVSREADVDRAGDVLAHPEYLSGYQRARLLWLFATNFSVSSRDFTAIADAYRDRDNELERGVTVVRPEVTQLVGTSTEVPVQLSNALPFQASIDVRVSPTSAALSINEQNYPQVELGAGATDRVLVPTRSRVSSGESGLRVELTALSNGRTIADETLPVRINTQLESVAIWGFGLVALALLGFGTWRSIRRRRRRLAATQPLDQREVEVPRE